MRKGERRMQNSRDLPKSLPRRQMCLDAHKHACALHTKITSRLLDA